nr:MAG TPA: hypothetical protein [Caudoviricetes sp.]
MYFRGFLHSLVCKNCSYAHTYWKLRAYWAGVKRKGDAFTPPKRCPNADLWFVMWRCGAEYGNDGSEFSHV